MLAVGRRLAGAEQCHEARAGVAEIGRILDVRALDASARIALALVLPPAPALAPAAVGVLLREQILQPGGQRFLRGVGVAMLRFFCRLTRRRPSLGRGTHPMAVGRSPLSHTLSLA